MQIRNMLTRARQAATMSTLILAAFNTAAAAAIITDDHDGHGAPVAPAPRSLAKPEPKTAPAAAKSVGAQAKSATAAREKGDRTDRPDRPVKPDTLGSASHADAAALEPDAHASDDASKPVHSKNAAKSMTPDESESVPDADTVLKWLRDGNQRWVAGKPMDPNIEPSRRARLAAVGQKPLATIVTCADSRVPVDRIFDRGVGELFVIRVAGNIAGDSETATVEYGVGHLKTPVLIVMGHSKCGAVAAAASGAPLHGKVAQLVALIVPSVERARRNNPGLAGDDLVAAAVRENVWQTVYDLFKKSPELAEMARAGKVRVIGAVCDISSGEVEFLGNHPWQAELIDALAAGRANTPEPAAPAHAAAPDHE